MSKSKGPSAGSSNHRDDLLKMDALDTITEGAVLPVIGNVVENIYSGSPDILERMKIKVLRQGAGSGQGITPMLGLDVPC